MGFFLDIKQRFASINNDIDVDFLGSKQPFKLLGLLCLILIGTLVGVCITMSEKNESHLGSVLDCQKKRYEMVISKTDSTIEAIGQNLNEMELTINNANPNQANQKLAETVDSLRAVLSSTQEKMFRTRDQYMKLGNSIHSELLRMRIVNRNLYSMVVAGLGSDTCSCRNLVVDTLNIQR